MEDDKGFPVGWSPTAAPQTMESGDNGHQTPSLILSLINN